MSKQYFAKNILDKGKPKVGDKVLWIDPDRGISTRIYTVTDIFTDEVLYIKDDFSEAEVFFHECQKVNLSLCARDIEDEPDLVNTMGERGQYKVIGRISSNAIWIKENDEFTEDELAIQDDTGEDRPIPFIKIDKEDLRELKNAIICVRCPCCGEFR